MNAVESCEQRYQCPVPADLPAGTTVFCAHEAGVRTPLRLAQGRKMYPSATLFDRRTLQLSPESGHQAGSGVGYKLDAELFWNMTRETLLPY